MTKSNLADTSAYATSHSRHLDDSRRRCADLMLPLLLILVTILSGCFFTLTTRPLLNSENSDEPLPAHFVLEGFAGTDTTGKQPAATFQEHDRAYEEAGTPLSVSQGSSATSNHPSHTVLRFKSLEGNIYIMEMLEHDSEQGSSGNKMATYVLAKVDSASHRFSIGIVIPTDEEGKRFHDHPSLELLRGILLSHLASSDKIEWHAYRMTPISEPFLGGSLAIVLSTSVGALLVVVSLLIRRRRNRSRNRIISLLNCLDGSHALAANQAFEELTRVSTSVDWTTVIPRGLPRSRSDELAKTLQGIGLSSSLADARSLKTRADSMLAESGMTWEGSV